MSSDEFTEAVRARIMGEAMLAFVTARLDEEGARANVMGLRRIAGTRLILARYEDTLARQEDDDYPAGVAQEQAREYEDFVLPGLAVAWNDHPDYDQEWTP